MATGAGDPGRGAATRADLVALAAAGSLDQADRGQGDVDQVELVGQRLHDAAEPVVAVAEERFAQVAPRSSVRRSRRSATVGRWAIWSFVCVAASMFRSNRCSRGSTRVIATPSTGPSGPPDPVDVGVRVGRDVEVDDVRDMLDVEPAGGHVRRHEYVQRPIAEAAHDPVAGFLGEPAVERARSWPRALSASARSSTSPRVRAKTRVDPGSSTSDPASAASLPLRRTT